MKLEKNIYFPLFASRQLNGGVQSDEESNDVWEKVMALPDARRNILLSNNLVNAIAVLDEPFHVPEQFVEYITVLVREMFFGNLTEQDILRALRQELTKIPHLSIDTVIQHVQLNIFQAKPDPDEPDEPEEIDNDEEIIVPTENTKQYALLDALSQYSNLTNQTITSENIKLKSQVALVRPTLTNWLKNYRDELGIGKHDSVARAHFLFESPNTKKLSSNERDRIHAIVRSLEDNELLAIDTVKQEIVFSFHKEKPVVQKSYPASPQAETSSPDIFERFQNVQSTQSPLPAELRGVGTQTFGGGKPSGTEKPAAEMAVLTRIKNMLVTPPKANAPAPKEDFEIETQQRVLAQDSGQQPLGTLRFFAKHILPVERQVPLVNPVNETRLEHFRPQPVPIPGEQHHAVTGPQQVVHAGQIMEKQIVPKPVVVPMVAQTPAPTAEVELPLPRKPIVPQSMFRIKPNRD